MSDSTIILRHDVPANQWLAHFQGKANLAYGSDLPLKAVRRLLEGTERESGVFRLQCEDGSVAGVPDDIVWDDPELFRTCVECNATGTYTGLAEVETCRTCCGRKVVPV